MIRLAILLPLIAAPLSPCGRQPTDDPAPAAIQMANPRTQRWQFGVVVRARGDTNGIVATLPVPMPWPEQDVKVLAEDATPHVRSVEYRVLDKGVKQMVVTIPQLAAGEEASALLTLEITKRDIVAPQSTDQLRVPDPAPRALRTSLGPSPYIETNDRAIREAAHDVISSKQGAWSQVEALYDWTRDKVQYKFDPQIKGARQSLDDGVGDCEELTSLFVALCRAVNIPARCVWIPGHCYPEFYLEDEQGTGHWYPCQAAGTRFFGAMPESRPILQKGDNYRVPGQRQRMRYVQETLTARNAAADPQVQFVQKQL